MPKPGMPGMVVGAREREALRTLASKWMELAQAPVMAERTRQWRAVKDLRAERPMILVETCMLGDYIGQEELVNTEPYLRNIEKSLFEIVRHAEEIGDDIVVEPRFRLPWVVELSDYGLPIEAHHATTTSGNELGYSFDFSVKTPADLSKLHFKTRRLDREKTAERLQLLGDLFGDILPLEVGGYDPFDLEPGYQPWLGNLHAGITMDFFKLAGNEALLYWVYDEPEAVHALMRFLTEDRKRQFRWLEAEGLLYRNTDTWMPCPGSYGFVSELETAPPGGAGAGQAQPAPVRLADCWGWSESQETASISPAMFKDFFLPYIAEINALFGLSYYGCCEGLHDRIELVIAATPNLRAVSVSGWSDLFRMGEILGGKYVYSRKPNPAFISGPSPDWELLEKDLRDTLAAARDCHLEFCFRDIYTVDGDRSRLRRWVELARALLG